MFCRKKPIFRTLLGLAMICTLGCGVKGDPLPPEKPADIGRGRPTYKRASEEIQMQKTSTHKKTPVKSEHNGDDEDDDDERN